MKKQQAVVLALGCVSAGASQLVFADEWFPPHPGKNDAMYIVFQEPCPQIFNGTPTLEVIDADFGIWQLEYSIQAGVQCLGDPLPADSSRTYAFAMPAWVGDVRVDQVVVKKEIAHPLPAFVQEFRLWRPAASTIPPSIGGIWTATGHRDQGLLINYDERRQAVVSWETYAADGTQAWMRGVASTIGSTEETFVVSLIDPGLGTFADADPSGDPGSPGDDARNWGEIALQYLQCGSLHLAWSPAAYTGLEAGEAEMTQVTGSYSAPCNLESFAAASGGQAVPVEFELVLEDDASLRLFRNGFDDG